jgi:hypothetical protein
MIDTEKLARINKENLDSFHKRKVTAAWIQFTAAIINVFIFVFVGWCCYQWGYDKGQHDFKSTIVQGEK